MKARWHLLVTLVVAVTVGSSHPPCFAAEVVQEIWLGCSAVLQSHCVQSLHSILLEEGMELQELDMRAGSACNRRSESHALAAGSSLTLMRALHRSSRVEE